MKQVLTLVVRIEPTAEQYKLLDDTAVAFASACTWINDNVNSNLTNRNSIQAVCYRDVKSQFGLTSNHVVRACARVGANRLTAKQKKRKVKGFKPTSFDCDTRTFRIIESSATLRLNTERSRGVEEGLGTNREAARPQALDFTSRERTSPRSPRILHSRARSAYLASVSTTGKRVKVPMRVSNYHIGKLQGQNPTSAQVCLHRDGNFYIHIQLKSQAPKPRKTKNVIGVDFGRRDIAVTSTGQSWSGKSINNARDKYTRTRASLQNIASQGAECTAACNSDLKSESVGSTRSTRRRCRETLKRLSGRERRFQTWLNHNISSSIINEAVATNSSVAIEDLTGIRERTNEKPRNKTERSGATPVRFPHLGNAHQERRSNSWAFYQLRTFLEYKGIKKGVNVIAIPPAYTSQTCHKCLHIHPVLGKSYRSGKSFKCGNCGNTCDADFNASKMIEIWGCSVNQPGGSELLSCLGDIRDVKSLMQAPNAFRVQQF